MDYEKKYNEALERAKKVKHDIENIGCSMAPDMLEVIFPELAESEDERIRKWLIDDIKRRSIGWTHSEFTGEQILAWLEKQKEPTTEELYAEAGTTEKEYIANTMKMVRAMREKQKEQQI